MSATWFRVRVTGEELDPARMLSEVARPEAGATVLFVGTVRDHSTGREGVTHLVYEAYAEHVEARIKEICEEAGANWPILAASVEHRVGTVSVGQPSVAVAVSTGHRDEAFSAGRFLIDELKARAPIWKQENWEGGREWVEGA
jgi:molybdopterin synthase catalytic subunit